jgi:hypothetical protein
MSKIAHNLPILPQERFLAGDESSVSQILDQPFHFLSRGLQSFVFLSEDGQYVLKVFNNCYQRRNALYGAAKWLIPWRPLWAMQEQHKALSKLSSAFASYHIAAHSMQEQTALLYVHAAPTTTLPSTLTLVDPLNIAHHINPNRTGFLIQKKVSLAYPALQKFLDQGDLESAKNALHSLVQLFIWKHRHHIADSDPLIRTNYGFFGTQAIQLDVGPLSVERVPSSDAAFHQELIRITTSLKHFLEPRSPELTAALDQQLQQTVLSSP